MRLFRWLTATKTRKILLTVGIVVAIPLLALAWWLGSPLFLNKTVDEEFPLTANAVIPDSMSREEAEQTMEEAAAVNQETREEMVSNAPVSLKTGSFSDEDRLHRGSGDATIYALADGSNLLRLEEIDVTNGPDLFVLLMRDPEGRDKDQGYIDLGRLKGNRGNQNYEIPDDIAVEDYNAVMIYCRAFSVIFTIAPLGGSAV